MAYTPITNAEIDPDSPLTTGLFSKLRDNTEFGRDPVTGTFIDSGFTDNSIAGSRIIVNSLNGNRLIDNSVGQLQIGAGAIHQSELDTGEDIQSYSVTAALSSATNFGSSDVQTLSTEPNYGLDVRTSLTIVSGNSGRANFVRGTSSSSNFGLNRYSSLHGVLNQSGGGITPRSWTGESRGRYVTASPPNTIRGEEVGLIVYVRRDGDGKVNGVASLETPPWVYNGPTNNEPSRVKPIRDKHGKLIRVEKYAMEAKGGVAHPRDGGDLDKWLESREQVEVLVTPERKEADMNLIAHPYPKLREGETVCLVDPFSPLMDKLRDLHRSGESIPELFQEGFLKLTKEIDCAKPDAVIAQGVRWKKSRRK